MKNKFKANSTQKKAFDRVVKAIESAKNKGLRFYGMQWDLAAYTDYAEKYISDNGYVCGGSKTQIPFLSATILSDSGADDCAKFIKEEHNPEYNDIINNKNQ